MPKPLVTVLVPTIGRLKYWDSMRASLAAQTLADLEIVVLDNASPPETQDIIEAWRREDARVRVLRAESRLPMFDNFNRGLVAAETKYVTFFHDDDVYLPRQIEAQIEVLEKNPRAGFSGSNFDYVDENGAITEERRWIAKTDVWRGKDYIEALWSRARNLIPMPGVVFRTAALDPGGFDTKVSMHFGDFVILARIAERHDVAMIAEPLMRVRRHSEQASQAMPMSRIIRMRTEILSAYLDEYEARWPEDRGFVKRLRRRLEVLHRVGLGWGWLSADGSDEATACAEALGDTLLDRGARFALTGADKLHLRQLVEPKEILRLGRRMSRRLGV
jgi:glycosyltransferase involved in cell wall biosynthesis